MWQHNITRDLQFWMVLLWHSLCLVSCMGWSTLQLFSNAHYTTRATSDMFLCWLRSSRRADHPCTSSHQEHWTIGGSRHAAHLPKGAPFCLNLNLTASRTPHGYITLSHCGRLLKSGCCLVVNATPLLLYSQERPSTHCIRGWMGPKAGLDGCGKSPESVSQTVQPLVSRYTNRAALQVRRLRVRFPLVSL